MINPVKPGGWALNEKLTSPQMTQVDLNTSYALDKRAGQTDTLSSTITVAGSMSFTNPAGGISIIGSNLILSGGSYQQFNSCGILLIGSSNISLYGTSYIDVNSGTSLNLNSGSNLYINSGSTATLSSTFNVNSGGSIALNGTSNITVSSSSASIILSSGSMIIGTSANGFYLQSPQQIQFATTRTYTRIVKSAPSLGPTGGTTGYEIISSAPNIIKTTSASSFPLVWNLDIPNLATITGFNVFFQPAGSHAGLPSSLPFVSLHATNILTKTTNTVSATDTSGTVAAYETYHSISATGLSITVDNSALGRVFRLVFNSEGNTNALLGALIYGATVTYTLDQMDDAR